MAKMAKTTNTTNTTSKEVKTVNIMKYENAFFIFEDLNLHAYIKRKGKDSNKKRNKIINKYNFNNCLSSLFQNFNFSFARNNVSNEIFWENTFFAKLEKNVKQFIKELKNLKKYVNNIYIFIKFVNTKYIRNLSTYYYLKFIIEHIYERRLHTFVRAVLPISNVKKLYSYIYFEKFSFVNYYKNILSKEELQGITKHFCPAVVLSKHNKSLVTLYRKIFAFDVVRGNAKSGKKKGDGNCRRTETGKEKEKEERKGKRKEKRKEIKIEDGKGKGKGKEKKEKMEIEKKTEKKREIQKQINRKLGTCAKKKISTEMKMDKKILNNRMIIVGSDEKKKIIRIEKDKIKRAITKYLKKNDIVLFAGTFDKVHLGHVLLIFYSIFLSNKFLYIGLYNNKNLCYKKCSVEIDDFNLRLFNISSILFLIKNVYQMNFFFMNYSNILPFLKMKNAHKIFYELVNCQREKVKLEWKRGKYKKYVTSYCKDKENDKNTQNARHAKNVTNNDIYGKLMKYLFLINNRLDIHFRRKKKVPENISIIKKEKRNILRYLCFYIEATENKNFRHRKNKVIVLKRIYDPFDLVLDIKDSLSMTLSRETEPSGVAVWEKRKTKFEQNKMKWLERQRIQHQQNQNQQKRQIMVQLYGRDFKQENATEQLPDQVHVSTKKVYNVCDKCDQLPYYSPTTWRKNNITILNVFDTIDLNIGEKVSATRIRKENIWLKEKKGSKLLRYFISACLFFDIEIFLIEKYVNLFLQRKIEKSENNKFLKKVKSYFCKKKWIYEKQKDENQNIDKKQLNEKYISNDFFRNIFILLSFFINHFMDGSSKYKVPFFIKIAVALCYFFYDNINLLIIKKEEKRLNENGLKPYVTMLNNHSENIFRTYINNVDEHCLLQIINQLLIMTILLLSLSILCNLFHYVHNKKSDVDKQDEVEKKDKVDKQDEEDKQDEVDKRDKVDKQDDVEKQDKVNKQDRVDKQDDQVNKQNEEDKQNEDDKQNDVDKKIDSNKQDVAHYNKTVEKNANDTKLVTLHKTHKKHKTDMKIKRINKNNIKYPYFIYMLLHFLNTEDLYNNNKKRKCKQKEPCDSDLNTLFSKHNVEHTTSSFKEKGEISQSKNLTENLLNKTHMCQKQNIKKTIALYYQQVISERKKWNKEGILIDKEKRQVEIIDKENQCKEKQNTVNNNRKCFNLEHKNMTENHLTQFSPSSLTSFFVKNCDALQSEQCTQDVFSDTRHIYTNCKKRTDKANMNTDGNENMDSYDNENKRLNELSKQIIYSDDNDTPLFRKTQIYKYVDNYLIDFFRFYSAVTLKSVKNKKKHTYSEIKNFDDLLFIFLINFEKHVEIIINSYIVQKWEMVKRKQKNDHFDVYNKYMNTFSIIHKFLNTNISPFNNFQDFEKTYDSNKKKNKSYKNTPFYIKKISFKYTNIFSFYYVIFQHISEQKNSYYPYFAMLNILLE